MSHKGSTEKVITRSMNVMFLCRHTPFSFSFFYGCSGNLIRQGWLTLLTTISFFSPSSHPTSHFPVISFCNSEFISFLSYKKIPIRAAIKLMTNVIRNQELKCPAFVQYLYSLDRHIRPLFVKSKSSALRYS